jgi:hypothetical protein
MTASSFAFLTLKVKTVLGANGLGFLSLHFLWFVSQKLKKKEMLLLKT